MLNQTENQELYKETIEEYQSRVSNDNQIINSKENLVTETWNK